MATYKQKAIKLLDAHGERIADMIVRQARELGPTMKAVDMDTGRHSIAGMMRSLSQVLGSAPVDTLLSVVETLVQLRMAVGVKPEDMLSSSYVYLPVIRWVFVEESDDPLDGLYAYEEVEAVVVPLLAKVAVTLHNAEPERLGVDDELFAQWTPFSFLDEDEDTVTDRRRRR
jgi:hypothetical protein